MSTRGSENKSRTSLYIIVVVIIAIIVVIGVVSYELTRSPPESSPTATPTASPSPTPSSISLTLYGGIAGTSQYGFGNSSDSITSPGPTLNLIAGQSYTMTLHNVDEVPHSWAIVPTQEIGTPLFNAGIATNNFLQPNQSGSVTFTPDQTGNFYYVCTVPGHIELGMWGQVTITN